MIASNLDVALAGDGSKCRLRSKVDEFPSEIALVLWDVHV